jgi:hypothetical protein
MAKDVTASEQILPLQAFIKTNKADDFAIVRIIDFYISSKLSQLISDAIALLTSSWCD